MRRRGRRGGGTVRRKGRSFEARWFEGGERSAQGGFATRDHALQFLQQRSRNVVIAEGLADLGLPIPGRPKPPSRTIGSLVEEWFVARAAEGTKTVNEDRWRWARHLERLVSPRTPDSIEPKDLHRWVTALRNPDPTSKYADGTRTRPISGPTAQRALHLLSAFYRWAVREGHATQNPCRGLRRDVGMAKMLRSTHTPDSTVVLQSKADLERLYRAIPVDYVADVRQPAKRRENEGRANGSVKKAAPKKYRAPNPVPIAYLLSALAGLRPGEVLPLEWADVDLHRRVIHVRRNYRNGVISLPKSGKGREVPIVPYLAKELLSWQKKLDSKTVLVCPPVRNSKRGENCFLGTPLIKRTLNEACDECGFARGDSTTSEGDRSRRSRPRQA